MCLLESHLYGLKATKNDKNKNLNIIQSNRHKADDSLQTMKNVIWLRWQEKKVCREFQEKIKIRLLKSCTRL